MKKSIMFVLAFAVPFLYSSLGAQEGLTPGQIEEKEIKALHETVEFGYEARKLDVYTKRLLNGSQWEIIGEGKTLEGIFRYNAKDNKLALEVEGIFHPCRFVHVTPSYMPTYWMRLDVPQGSPLETFAKKSTLVRPDFTQHAGTDKGFRMKYKGREGLPK
ncbi:MAG: hypothetical protein KGJ06_01120 [Pseudomonadota bacterium]|nr:hypothetical protein [Pseudomonadota bacterium]